eukprot:scaffold22101_cov114-Isochrysis_galbana.AAC.2
MGIVGKAKPTHIRPNDVPHAGSHTTRMYTTHARMLLPKVCLSPYTKPFVLARHERYRSARVKCMLTPRSTACVFSVVLFVSLFVWLPRSVFLSKIFMFGFVEERGLCGAGGWRPVRCWRALVGCV